MTAKLRYHNGTTPKHILKKFERNQAEFDRRIEAQIKISKQIKAL